MKWNVSHFSTVYVTWNSWKFIFSWNFIGFQWTKRVPLMKWIPWHTHEVHGFFVFNQTFVVEDKVEDPPRPIDCSVSDRRVTSTPSQLWERIQSPQPLVFCLPWHLSSFSLWWSSTSGRLDLVRILFLTHWETTVPRTRFRSWPCVTVNTTRTSPISVTRSGPHLITLSTSVLELSTRIFILSWVEFMRVLNSTQINNGGIVLTFWVKLNSNQQRGHSTHFFSKT